MASYFRPTIFDRFDFVQKYAGFQEQLNELKRELTVMGAEPAQGGETLDLLLIAKYFKRIGYPCDNIAK